MNEKEKLAKALAERASRIRKNKLSYYDPYQFQVDLHNDTERFRTITAGNRVGKTESGGAELAFHLTGLYPDWWEGRRFDHPVKCVAAGKNNEKTRDLIQSALFGDPSDDTAWGTGWVPAHLIGKPTRKPGIPDAKYHVPVKHVSGKWSKVTLLAYDMGKESWMGHKSDVVWLDEEPPEDIMSQAIRSVIDTGGSIYMTFTPENGTTGVLKTVQEQWSTHKATWNDVASDDFEITVDGHNYEFTKKYTMKGRPGHLSKTKIEDAAKGMRGFEFKMRCNGEPLLGTGLVFAYSETDFKIEPIPIPKHWRRIAAIDFGGINAHPTAIVWGAWDEEADIIYLYDAIRVRNKTIPEVAGMILGRPQWIPMIWPHDGNKVLGQGEATKQQYANCGVNMFHTHFTNPPADGKEEGKGGILIKPGIDEMNSRMNDGRIKIFSTLNEWFEEYRQYHMNDGKIVDRDDDLISASRYLIQSLRHSVVSIKKKRKLNTIPQAAGWMG